MSVNSKMTAIADAIRDKTGGTNLLTLDDMAVEVPKVYEAGQQAERIKVEGEIEALEAEIAGLTEQEQTLEADIARYLRTIEELNKSNGVLVERIINLQYEVEQLNSQIAEKQSQIATLNAQITMYQQSVAEFEAEITTLTEQKQTLEADIVMYQRLIEENNEIRAGLTEKILTLEDEVEQLNSQIAEKQSQIDALNSRISELEAEVNSQIELRLEAEAEAKMWKADAVAQNELRLEAEAQLPIKYQEGHADGVKSEYDRFWDDFQQNGTRTIYTSAFGPQWTTETFKPKYPMRPTTARMMFYNNTSDGIKIADFVTFCKENNVVLDFSQCTNADYALSCLHSPHFGVLDFSKARSMQYLFYSHNWTSDWSVKTIDEFISSETTTYHSTTFQAATYLVNLNMKGVIATNNYNVSYCPLLSHDSLTSIINCLQDKTGDTSGTTWKVTLGTTNKAKLTDAELQIAYGKNWAVA